MPRVRVILQAILPALCLLLLCPLVVNAESLDDLFTRLCAEYGVSRALTVAIAQAESGMNPLAVNVAGKGYSPGSQEEATALIQSAHRAGQSYDVGLMQINRQWTDKWGMAPEALLDPEANIRAGLTILSGEIARRGWNWQAVGAYHSPTPEKGRRYAWNIYQRQANAGAAVRSEHGKQTTPSPKKRPQGLLLYRRGQSHHGSGEAGRAVHINLD
jgi:hypothetical protein